VRRTAWLIAVVLGHTTAASAQREIIATTVVSGTLRFEADATLGRFTGTTATVTGALTGGPSPELVRGWVESPVDSLRTGNGMRDRDMRKALQADRFPTIRFELDELRPSPIQGDSMVATLAGRFTIHGVTRAVTMPALLVWLPDGIRLEATAAMDVRDYQIGGLSRMLGTLRMRPDIVVHVHLLFAQTP